MMEDPCRAMHSDVLSCAQISHLSYWLAQQQNHDISFKKLQLLSSSQPEENMCSLAGMPRIAGLIPIPGPKNPHDVHNLIRALCNDLDADAIRIYPSLEQKKKTALLGLPPWTYGVTFLEPARRRLTVAIRGTASLVDLAVDAAAIPYPLTGGLGGCVHLGFLSRLRATGLVDIISSLARDARSVRITGHSMGGALGVLLAAEIASICSARVTVTSFGCPRVGNAAFSVAFDSLPHVRHFRVQVAQTNTNSVLK